MTSHDSMSFIHCCLHNTSSDILTRHTLVRCHSFPPYKGYIAQEFWVGCVFNGCTNTYSVSLQEDSIQIRGPYIDKRTLYRQEDPSAFITRPGSVSSNRCPLQQRTVVTIPFYLCLLLLKQYVFGYSWESAQNQLANTGLGRIGEEAVLDCFTLSC